MRAPISTTGPRGDNRTIETLWRTDTPDDRGVVHVLLTTRHSKDSRAIVSDVRTVTITDHDNYAVRLVRFQPGHTDMGTYVMRTPVARYSVKALEAQHRDALANVESLLAGRGSAVATALLDMLEQPPVTV